MRLRRHRQPPTGRPGRAAGRQVAWRPSPGGLVAALEPVLRQAPRRLGGLDGLGGGGPAAVRGRGHAPRRRAAVVPGDRRVLRGHVERDAVAALPRRHRDAPLPPALVGHLPRRQPALRRRRRHDGCDRCDRLGAGLPAAARAAAAARRPAGPADRLLQPHPVPARTSCSPSCPGDARCSTACSAPTSSASSGRPTPTTSCGPAGGRGWSPGGARSARPASAASGRCGPRRSRSPWTPTASARSPGGRRSSRGLAASAPTWGTRSWCCWGWTGSTTPRGSCTGCRRCRSCTPTSC